MILCIVPDAGMADTFKKVVPNFSEKIIVERGLLEEAIPIAKRYEEEADAIISRGGTVLAIRDAGIATPLVELQVTAKDLALALEHARALTKKLHYKIGVMTFPNMTQQLSDFLPFFNLDLKLYELTIETDMEKAIAGAVRDGIDVLLGGVITSKLSTKLGVPMVRIESGESSIRYALEEASKISAARRLNNRRMEELRVITENIREGILASDKEGKIFRMNSKAKDLLQQFHRDQEWGYGSKIPAEFFDIIIQGKEQHKVIEIGAKRVVVESIPVKVEGVVTSSILTLQDVGTLQKIEEDIRRDIYFKGYVAKFRFEDIIREDATMKRVVDLAKRFARTNASILISGESGVGKEVFAQSIHNESARGSGAFVAMNCAAIPEPLFESEMFGYVDGAFTGARKKGKPGLFEIAHGGTVFLDEISEMPQALQARLLRVLQEHQVMRLGDDKIIPVNVRIIAASNRDLPALVQQGIFRNDLYWRLNVLNLSIPPLRSRRDDIIPLIERMLDDSDICGRKITLSSESATLLRHYSWPGNVRELRNFCERVVAICENEELSADLARSLLDSGTLPPSYYQKPIDAAVSTISRSSSLEKASTNVKSMISDLIRETGSVGAAADRLGIHRTTLWRRLKRDNHEG